MNSEAFEICCGEVLNAEKRNTVNRLVTAGVTTVIGVIYCMYLLYLVLVKGTTIFEISMYAVAIIFLTIAVSIISLILVHKNIRNLFKKQEEKGLLVMLRPYVAELDKKFYLVFKPFHGDCKVKIEISEDEFFTYHKEFVEVGDCNYFVFTKNKHLFERKFEIFYN